MYPKNKYSKYFALKEFYKHGKIFFKTHWTSVCLELGIQMASETDFITIA